MSVEGAVQPIGASLVHFLEGSNNPHDDDRADSTGHVTNDNDSNQIEPMDTSESQDANNIESSLPANAAKDAAPPVHHPCLLLDGCNGNDDNIATNSRNRILLCGPSGSGKTSLALNLAYSLAGSAAPCLCFDPRMCRCTAVTIYKAATPAGAGARAADEDFPLHCRPVVAGDSETAVENDHAIEIQNEDGRPTNQDHDMGNGKEHGNKNNQNATAAGDKDKTSALDWDPQILKRIRIHRVTSVRELLYDLLCLLGKPLQEQPRAGGAIVIDDIDQIAAMQSQNEAAATSMAGKTSWNAHHTMASAAILQIIAVATDSAIALESSQEGSPKRPITVLVTTEDTRTVLSPCIDTIVTLQPHEALQQQQQQTGPVHSNHSHQEWMTSTENDGDGIQVESVWNAEIQWSPWISNDDRGTLLEYAVLQMPDEEGEKEIRWKSLNGDGVTSRDV